MNVRQICGGYPDALTHCAQLIEEHVTVDFVDINMGCPIDIVCNRCVASMLTAFYFIACRAVEAARTVCAR